MEVEIKGLTFRESINTCASMRLIPQKVADQLKKANVIEIQHLMLGSIREISHRSQLSELDLKHFRNMIGKRIASICYLGNAANLLASPTPLHHKLSTGSSCLDAVLGGGLVYPSLVEIAGDSGTGKTQLCLQLAVSAQMPVDLGGVGLNRSVAYICTEDSFPSSRFKEIIEARAPQIYRHRSVPIDKSLFQEISDRVYIEKADTSSGLEHYLTRWIPKLVEEKNLGLLLVDSIAGALRDEFIVDPHGLRAETLWRIAKLLRSITFKYNIPVVCINQVTAVIENGELSPKRNSKAAMGLVWSSVVNERYVLCKREVLTIDTNDAECSTTTRRLFSVELSSHLPEITVPYIINTKGIKLI